MKILIKNVGIIDPQFDVNGIIIKDLLINDGVIDNIAEEININADIIFEEADLKVSLGWVDIFSNFCSPGFEHKETFESGVASAIAGGFTQVFVLPNTNPTTSSQSQVNYILEKSKGLKINVSPIASISKKIDGGELAEMYDMFNAGAVAFSDGTSPVQSTSLFLKALQYIKPFNGTIIQSPIDASFSKIGLINEGIISTRLGLPGIPDFAENLMIKRDIELLRYAQSKLHLTGISTIEGINLIESAKKEGLNITCSVAPHHLLFCDEDLVNYDTNLKVNPPLRTRTEMVALRQAVLDGKVDCIASHHLPQHIDEKICEFEYAKNGMISLQTVFTSLNTLFPELSTQKIVDLLCIHPRKIFNLPIPKIEVGMKADLTLFTRNNTTKLTKMNNKSKSINSPLIDVEQQGKVIGVVSKGILLLN
jgi:dihydroorotase